MGLLINLFNKTCTSFWSGVITLFFLVTISSLDIYAQAPDEMYVEQIKDSSLATEKIAVDPVLLEAELLKEQQANKTKIGINTITQLISIQENRLLEIAQDSQDLDKSNPELKILQDDRILVLAKLEHYAAQLDQLNQEEEKRTNQKEISD